MPGIRLVPIIGAALGAALGGVAAAGTVQGSATYRERIAVPPDATLVVELQDVSRADAPATVLAAQRYALKGVPAQFELNYDDALIREGMRYVLRGSIYRGDRLWFTTDTAYPVLTQGEGNAADLVLVQVGSQGAAMLDNTSWTVAELGGVALDAEKKPEIVFATDGVFGGTGGCNRFRGQAEISGNSIDFPDNMAATLMACPPPLDEIERQFFKALQSVTTFARKDDSLALLDASGAPIILLVGSP